jgi:hypothetical protein
MYIVMVVWSDHFNQSCFGVPGLLPPLVLLLVPGDIKEPVDVETGDIIFFSSIDASAVKETFFSVVFEGPL